MSVNVRDFAKSLMPRSLRNAIEQQMLAELGSIFQRHRGQRIAICHFRMSDNAGPWERTVIYRHALISGSDAMYREVARLIALHGWGTSTERLTNPAQT